MKTKQKLQTYREVCEKLVDARIIAGFRVRRVDASMSGNGSLMFTEIQIIKVFTETQIVKTTENCLLDGIHNETYGRQSMLYLSTKFPNALWAAMACAGIDMRTASQQERRIIMRVKFFKGYHWWE